MVIAALGAGLLLKKDKVRKMQGMAVPVTEKVVVRLQMVGKQKSPGLWPGLLLSGKRDSNSRPQPWQGCALPTELFPLDEL